MPTRRRGLVRKRHGPTALVDTNFCTATNNNNNNTARASTLTSSDNTARMVYQGDFFGPKRSDWLRLVSLNLDNLAIDINESKEVSLFQSILEQGINILLLQELGLHWSNLSRTKQWRSRVECFLNPKCTRTRCSHNVHHTTGTQVQAQGTGILSHDKVSHFAMGSGCNKAKLGWWTWSRFRGIGGMVLRVVSVYRPCASSGGE